ncbi:MAG: hypothetical protein HZA15_16150 [Nitrospirae bacterium]|nr:hypothetical protein [Nitrospirota bacterium]
MKTGENVSFLFLACALLFLLNACVPAVSMKYEELAKGDIHRGSVVVGTVSNKRPDANGNSFDLVGRVRGGYGNPFALKTEPGKEIDVLLREVAEASLKHTGYTSEQVAGKSSRLDIDILKFWCDGYMGYKIWAEIEVKLINSTDGKTLTQKNINVQKGFTLIGSYGPMHMAFDEVINGVQKELVAFMQSEEFQAAVK